MDNKIQEITDKLYKEGVERGDLQAQRIIGEAHEKETEILKVAHERAEKIVADARREAESMKRSTEAELQLYCKQALESLKTALTDVVSGRIVDMKSLFEDRDFMRSMILKMVEEWSKNEELVVSADRELDLKNYFSTKAKELLDKGLKIEEINGKPTSFVVSPKNGAYKVEFGESAFENYFKDFMRPQLVDLLFKK